MKTVETGKIAASSQGAGTKVVITVKDPVPGPASLPVPTPPLSPCLKKDPILVPGTYSDADPGIE